MADPRRARTRRRLLDAGHHLIGEKGIGELRIAEITREAGVALGSFQNHFESKEGFVEAVVSETLEALAAEIVDSPPTPDDPAVVAITALRRFVRLAYDDPTFSRLLVNLGRSEELFLEAIRPFAETALKRAADTGVFQIEDLDIAVTSIVAGSLAVIRRILDGHVGPDADVVLARTALLGFGVDAESAAEITSLPVPRAESWRPGSRTAQRGSVEPIERRRGRRRRG
jgi:AcrR family transcriptional regulator